MIKIKLLLSVALTTIFLLRQIALAQVQVMGDTMLGSKNNNLHEMENFFTSVKYILDNKKVLNIINLEGVISGTDYTPKCVSGSHCFVFNMDSIATKALHDNNIQIANLANNHSMDLGFSGRADTISNLNHYGIIPVGTEQNPSATYTVDDKKFVVIGASPHSNTFSIFNTDKLSQLIHYYKTQNYIVIITAHIGREGANAYNVANEDEIFLGQNRGNPIKIAHQMIDLGADAFLAHGPHVLRPLEIYKNRIIAYSLGNFITYGTFNLSSNSAYGGILNIQFNQDGTFKSGHFFATEQTKSLNPQMWQRGDIMENSPNSLKFLEKITNDHQPNMFVWNEQGDFNLKNIKK